MIRRICSAEGYCFDRGLEQVIKIVAPRGKKIKIEVISRKHGLIKNWKEIKIYSWIKEALVDSAKVDYEHNKVVMIINFY